MKDKIVEIPEGPFKPDWDSLQNYQVPEWYLNSKFGIFIHWGVYSVPAFENEWYPRNMYIRDSPAYRYHLERFGPHDKFGYKDFIPMFKAEDWNPKEWAALFKRAGAKYVVIVAEHHDGFAMYDCSHGKWNSKLIGPRRDVVGELARAVRDEDLIFGVSYHRAEHWWFFEPGMHFNSDVKDPRYLDLYGPAKPQDIQPDGEFLEDWLRRACEIIDKYRPQIFWFDWWIEQPAFEPYLRAFAAYYYNRATEWDVGVTINYKHNAFPEGAAVLDIERGKLDTIRPMFWQTDTSICKKSWGYINGHDYRSPSSILAELVDIVSKNGCLLLNIAPRPDGIIPEEQQKILLEVGKWLEINGESIYDARPWKVYGEGPTKVQAGEFKDAEVERFTERDFRFTSKNDELYVIAFEWPSEEVVVKSLSTDVRLYHPEEVGDVKLLGSKEPVYWVRDDKGLRLKVPKQRPCEHAFAIKVIKKTNEQAGKKYAKNSR